MDNINSLKTFSSIHLNDYKILNQAVVGIEVEFYSNISYTKLLELINIEFNPIKIWGFNEYHSLFKPDSSNFKIEPDYSGGPDMVELITGPMAYNESIIILIKLLSFIKKYGSTDEKCSIHLNISFKNIDVTTINKLTLILDIDENYIYDKFPSRKGNIYAKSVKNMIPYKEWDSAESAALLMSNSIHLPDETKYYGINIGAINRGWVEYRYIGGKDYQNKQSTILECLDYLILLTYGNINNILNDEHKIKIRSYLGEKINLYKKYKKYELLQANFPELDIQIDKNNDPSIIEAIYSTIYDRIYDLIGTSRVGPATVNYDTNDCKFEVMNTRIVGGINLLRADFINCDIEDTRIIDSDLISCNIFKSHIEHCEVCETEVKNSKLNECVIKDGSNIIDSYITLSTIDDATIDGGVFKPGSITKNTIIKNNAILPKRNNFWSTNNNSKKGFKK